MAIEKLRLPSNGILGVPEMVSVKSLTGKELGILYTSLSDAAIDEVIKNITTPNIDPNILSDEDKFAILFLARELTLGSSFEQHIRCPHCGNIHKYVLDHSEFNTIYLEDFNNEILLPNGDIIIKRIPTSNIMEDINFFKERNNVDQLDSFLLYLLARISKVKQSSGTEISNQRLIFDYLANLEGSSFVEIIDKIDTKFGVDMTFIRECPTTHEDIVGVLGINADFFRVPINNI